jgi:Fe2+ or Zn2+ uptake regulation protein
VTDFLTACSPEGRQDPGQEESVPDAVEAAIREDLRRAGLPGHGTLARLLALLRAAPETHLGLAEVVRMTTETGLATTTGELARQLDTLAEHGLLGRLLSATAEPVFDTVTEPHSHLVYEETAQIVDLRVSPETLLAIVRQVLTEQPAGVEILVRFRRDPVPASFDAGISGPVPEPRRRKAN